MAAISKGNAQSSVTTNLINRMNHINNADGPPIGRQEGRSSVNNGMLYTYEGMPSPEGNIAASLTGNVDRSTLIGAARTLAIWYARTVRGMYGVTGNSAPWTKYEIFFVNSENHTSHYNSVVNSINTDSGAELAGSVSLADLATYFTRLFNLINNARNSTTVDLRVCHSSCHDNCHSSRGRR